jgi:hypothetical protein
MFSYRQVQTFGRGEIRRFANNASDMKKLAGHNYENLLQVRSQNLLWLSFVAQCTP